MSLNLSTGIALPESGQGISRRSLFRGAGLGLLAAAGAKTLTACGNGGGDLSTVTYVSFLPFETLSYAPEMMAVAGGYAEEEGIEIEVEEARGTAPSLQAVISGAGLIGRCNTIDLANVRLEGQSLIAIGTLMRGAGQWLNYSQDNPVNGPEDLIGQTVGIPSEGGSTENNLMLMLHNAGIDPDQVERQVVTDGPGTWEMIQRGQLIGYLSSIDQSLILQSQQEDAGVAVPDDLSPVLSDVQYLVTTEEHIDNHGDEIRAYLAAVKAGMDSVVADSDDLSETIEALRSEYSFATLDDDEVAVEGLNIMRDLWTTDGAEALINDEENFLQGIQELEESGFVEGAENPDEWITNELLPDA